MDFGCVDKAYILANEFAYRSGLGILDRVDFCDYFKSLPKEKRELPAAYKSWLASRKRRSKKRN